MFIDKELWNKLKENIDNLYWDEDRMSRDGRYFLKMIDNNIKSIENKAVKEVFVVTNNSIIDDEVNYNIAGVCTSLSNAEKLYQKMVNNAKDDMDFNDLNAVEITDETDLNSIPEEWCYESDRYGFSLYLMGEYNSNNLSIQIERFKLDDGLNLDEKEIY